MDKIRTIYRKVMHMNDNIVVKVENLTKTFNGNEIIKNCNMTMRQGSIYGFLGANGAGKTTIFKMLTGLLKQTAGNIEVLGLEISGNRKEILKNIGSLIEVPVFYEHLSAAENLEMHLSYMGVENGNIPETLEAVGLVDTGKQAVSGFSLGMRQRLGIARALVHKPRLMILDEPINGLDPMGIREMRELFKYLVKEHGASILISSHILSEIEHIADIIGVIVNGTVMEEVTLDSIKESCPNGLEDYFFQVMERGEDKCIN